MNRLLLIILFLSLSVSAKAQKRLQYMVKAPRIETSVLLYGDELRKGVATYVDFFALDMPQNSEQLELLEELAAKYGKNIDVVLITRDNIDRVKEFFDSKEINFSIYHDYKGKTFKKYGVKFLPFSVVIDNKGNFVWQGKNSEITEDVILGVI